MGEAEGAPMFTFTSSNAMGDFDFTIPPPTYLYMISRGLKEVGLAEEEIVDYFLTKSGIKGEFTKDSLYRYIFR